VEVLRPESPSHTKCRRKKIPKAGKRETLGCDWYVTSQKADKKKSKLAEFPHYEIHILQATISSLISYKESETKVYFPLFSMRSTYPINSILPNLIPSEILKSVKPFFMQSLILSILLLIPLS
jgi:hypothetical protein